MERGNPPGLTPIALIVLSTVLGILLSVWVPWAFANDPIKASDWIGFAGSVLTTGVAAIAAYLAWRGITHQMRVDLVSREEDRIEGELPGLRDVEDKLAKMVSQFKTASAPSRIAHLLKDYQIGASGMNLAGAIDSAFPRANARTRRRLTELFFDLNTNVVKGVFREQDLKTCTRDLENINAFDITMHQAVRDGEQKSGILFDAQWIEIQAALKRLEHFREEAEARIASLQIRLTNVRAEIETHIDN